MPQRSNEFQKLIALIASQLAPQGADVQESRLLTSAITGSSVEVDIVIETQVAGSPLIIGIECRDHNRPATVEWIRELVGKYQHLPVNVTIAVSRSGFTAEARDWATKAKIQTISLSDAVEADWTKIVGKLQSLNIESFLLPYATAVTVNLDPEAAVLVINPSNLNNAMLFSPTGEQRGTLAAFVKLSLSDPNLIKALEQRAFTDAKTQVDLTIQVPAGSYIIDDSGKKALITGLTVTAICVKECSSFQLEQGAYGTTPVAFGSGETFGHQVATTFVEQPGQDIRFGMSIGHLGKKLSPPKPKKKRKKHPG